MEAPLAFLRHTTASAYPEVSAIRAGERYLIVRVQAIRGMEAAGSSVRLHLPQGSRQMRQAICDLEGEAARPRQFLRIHRSASVNLSHIVAVEPVSRTENEVVLDYGSHVPCSRCYGISARVHPLLRVGRWLGDLRPHPRTAHPSGARPNAKLQGPAVS